jgi:hypothetical protein
MTRTASHAKPWKKGFSKWKAPSYTQRARLSRHAQCTTVPEYSEQGTSVAVPTASPTPELPKKAAAAPESLHRSKLTFAPYWFVPVSPFCAHSGFPCTGQRLLTVEESTC